MLGFQSEALKVNKDRIYGGVIVCALRSMTQEHGIEMAELAGKYLKVNRSTEFNSYCIVKIEIYWCGLNEIVRYKLIETR